MKTIIGILFIVVALISGLLGYNVDNYLENKQNAPQELDLGYIGPAKSTNTMLEPTTTTTTDAWVTTISIDAPTSDVADGRLNVGFTGSTTGSVLNWYYYFSEDGVTWYGEDSASVSGDTTTHSTSSQKHTFLSGTTSEINMNFDLPDMISKFIRATFDVDTASGTLEATFIK